MEGGSDCTFIQYSTLTILLILLILLIHLILRILLIHQIDILDTLDTPDTLDTADLTLLDNILYLADMPGLAESDPAHSGEDLTNTFTLHSVLAGELGVQPAPEVVPLVFVVGRRGRGRHRHTGRWNHRLLQSCLAFEKLLGWKNWKNLG